jgi:membrane-bound serine protease (ClpP class)
MCHLILFMPALALPIFWIAPLNISIPIYMVIALTSAVLYWLIANSMRKTPIIGAESLPGTAAEVVSKLAPGHIAQYLVRSQGELWSARCPDHLEPGENVQIAAVNGINLLVERGNNGSHPDQLSDVEAARVGAKVNRRHCH